MRHVTTVSGMKVKQAVDYQVPLDAKLAFSQDIFKIVLPLTLNKRPVNPLPPDDTTDDDDTVTT